MSPFHFRKGPVPVAGSSQVLAAEMRCCLDYLSSPLLLLVRPVLLMCLSHSLITFWVHSGVVCQPHWGGKNSDFTSFLKLSFYFILESLQFTSFCMPECCLDQLLKISQILSLEVSTKSLIWCELIKFLEFQDLGKQQYSVWNCGVSCPEIMVFLHDDIC